MTHTEMELVFLSKTTLIDYFSAFKPISDLIAMMKIRRKHNKLVIIQVYAPTSEYAGEHIENFYCELKNVINCVSNGYIFLVNGDMNCKVGSLDIEESNDVGKHNTTERDYNVVKHLSTSAKKTSIANTQFTYQQLDTWISPGQQVENTIDFICIGQPAMKFIKDAHVLSTPDISDRRLVRCKMIFQFLCNKRYKNNILHFNSNLLSDRVVLDTYQHAVEDILPLSPNEDVEVNKIHHHNKSAVNEVQEIALGKKPKNTARDWITPQTLVQIQQKHKIHKPFGSNSVEHKFAKSICKNLCKTDKQINR